MKIYLNRLASSCLRCNALTGFQPQRRIYDSVLMSQSAKSRCLCSAVSSVTAVAVPWLRRLISGLSSRRPGFDSDLIIGPSYSQTGTRHIHHVSGVALFAVYPSVSGADSCKNLIMDKGHKSIPHWRVF